MRSLRYPRALAFSSAAIKRLDLETFSGCCQASTDDAEDRYAPSSRPTRTSALVRRTIAHLQLLALACSFDPPVNFVLLRGTRRSGEHLA